MTGAVIGSGAMLDTVRSWLGDLDWGTAPELFAAIGTVGRPLRPLLFTLSQ